MSAIGVIHGTGTVTVEVSGEVGVRTVPNVCYVDKAVEVEKYHCESGPDVYGHAVDAIDEVAAVESTVKTEVDPGIMFDTSANNVGAT